MSSPSNPTSKSDQGDPWEQLAEDLFGLEFGKEHGSRESSSPAVVPEAPAAVPAPIVRVEEPPERASVVSSVEAEPQHQAQPTFAAEPAFAEPAASPDPGSSQETDETSPPAVAEAGSPQDSYWDALANWNWDESEGSSSKARSEAPRSSGGPPPRGGPRGRDARGRDEGRDRRGGEKPQRQTSDSSSQGSAPAQGRPSAAEARHSSTSQPSAPRAGRSSSAAAGDDFGLGVADEPAEFRAPAEARATEDSWVFEPERPVSDTTSRDESSKPAPTSNRGDHRPGPGEPSSREPSSRDTGTDQGPAKQEEGEFPRKKRRRRRRRSRGGDRVPGSTTGPTTGAVSGETPAAESPASDDEWDDDSAGPETEAAEDEPDVPAADSREEVKDRIEGDRHVHARGPRRGPRNDRSRREGSPRRSQAASADAARSESRVDEGHGEFEEEPLLVGGGVEESVGEDDGEDDATEQAVSYEDVPTWEEAISYLLHPSQVQVEPGAGNGSAPGRQAPPADQPRQTRHMGGQKPRR
jgi:hypothetical protein